MISMNQNNIFFLFILYDRIHFLMMQKFRIHRLAFIRGSLDGKVSLKIYLALGEMCLSLQPVKDCLHIFLRKLDYATIIP